MKKRSTSLISVLLMVFLVFSMPFMTFAQPNPKYEDERAAAKADAERDADNDVNKLTWGCVGGVLGVVGTASAVLGCLVAAFEAESGDGLSADETLAVSLFIFGGGIVAVSPAVLAISIKPTPPSERLLGKSPEYVDTYVDTYVRKVRHHRRMATVKGAAVGAGILGISCLF